ncbi:MAG: type IV toxin-antitoxin system AbiEi family antitoxin domain-containing protein [Solirubrobacteraceae bacterium]
MADRIDHDRLYALAESQAGYFTAAQAIGVGMDRSTLRHHARPGGRYERVARGLYRLRHFPSAPHEHVMAAWLGLGEPGGVVSHASALELYDLSDVIPDAVHISVPRSKRGRRPRAGLRLHTLQRPPGGDEVRRRGGLPVTSPERTVLDALEAGTQPEQIELAIGQAVARGLTTPRRVRMAAASRSTTTRAFVDQVLRDGTP